MGAQLASAVHLQDPQTHQTVVLDPGTCPDPRLAALVTNPAAWVDGKLPRLKTADGAGPTGGGPDGASGDASASDAGSQQQLPDGDSPAAPAAKKTAARKTAASKPARGRGAADEASSGA